MNTPEAPNLYKPPVDDESVGNKIPEQTEQYPPQLNTPPKERDPYDQLQGDDDKGNIVYIHMGG